MKRFFLYTIFVAFLGCASRSQKIEPPSTITPETVSTMEIQPLRLEESTEGSGDRESISRTWYRGDIETVGQIIVESGDLSWASINPKGEKELMFAITFRNKRIASCFSTPSMLEHQFSLQDCDADGVPDFIQILEWVNGALIPVEACIIREGILVPIESELLHRVRVAEIDELQLLDEVRARLE